MKGNDIETKGEYMHFYSRVSKDRRAKRGLPILNKNKLRKYVTILEPNDKNFTQTDMNLFGHKITILEFLQVVRMRI